jgi:ketosteroid isomerase-like protein
MNAMQARDTVRRFINLINAQDVDGLNNLMTEDHRFVDALGQVVQGRDAMRGAWSMYFRMVPDYHISCNEMIGEGNVVAAFGIAGGTFSQDRKELLEENRWQAPVALRAEVKGDLVAEWRVYVDNEPIRRLMSKT